ncbi:hypothetical protein PFTANZ_06406, partial [Plasmodium falciparum Tanzania (2000708)]
MTCVERAAEELRKEAERAIDKIKDNKLKGDGTKFKSECNKVKKENNGGNVKDACDFEKTYKTSVKSLKETCNNNGMERFNIDQQWKCIKIKKIGKDLCIPPRREHMCLDDLSMLGRSTVNDSSALLKKVQEAAKSEGNDIIRKLLEENSCDEHRICDAMKYSFADLGDIIRGRDLWNTNSKQKGLESRLRSAFENIYKNVSDNKKHIYKKGIPHYIELRSDWWDANRKEVWKAMTCNAPDAAKFLKKDENVSSDSSSSKGIFSNDPNCGHKSEPPDYDYIPQPFRWMQEWSETFCKLLNEQMKQFETECKDCKNHGITCEGDDNGKKCERCKEQCKKYEELIDEWKNKFGKYNEIYKEIYINKDSTKTQKYVTKFIETLNSKCENVQTADKYLHEATQCTDYGFRECDSNDEKYAFKNPPKGFEHACKCEPPDPLNDCPKDDKHQTVCKNLSPIKSCEGKNFNNDLGEWTPHEVKDSTGNNKGVLVPPRRRRLCLRNINWHLNNINNKADFRNKFLQYVYTEGKFVGEKYKNDNKNALDAMRYSFYDYGDIIKGTDLISTTLMDKLKTKLDELLRENNSNEISKDRKNWWTQNKNRVWHAMLCGYKAAGGKIEEGDCTLPDDNTPQFLRWFQEWSEHFCATRQKLYDKVQTKCKSAKCDPTNGIMEPADCEEACTQYRDYITRKIQEYRLLNHQYTMNFKKQRAEDKNVPEYFKDKCKNKCQCLFEYIDIEKKWKNMYDSLNDNNLKNICDCIKIKPTYFPKNNKPKDETAPDEPKHKEDKIEPPEPPLPPADQPFDPTILHTTIPFGIAFALGSIAFLFLK